MIAPPFAKFKQGISMGESGLAQGLLRPRAAPPASNFEDRVWADRYPARQDAIECVLRPHGRGIYRIRRRAPSSPKRSGD